MNKYGIGNKRQSGSTLITIITAILIVAVLAAAIYTLNTVSLLNQVAAQREKKAYYISESGIRIAQSEYRQAVQADANTVHQKLPALHGKTFNMADNVSSFTIYVYPHWLYAKDPYAAGTTTITLYLPGGLPCVDQSDTAITFPTSGLLRIKDTRSTTSTLWTDITYVSFTATDATSVPFNATYGTPVTFTLSSSFNDAIATGDEFYIGYLVTQAATQSGNNLTLYVSDINMAQYFPPQGGTIFIPRNTTALSYKYDVRIIDSTVSPIAVTLTNIKDLDGNLATPSILSGNQVFIGKSVGFRSTSTYGGN